MQGKVFTMNISNTIKLVLPILFPSWRFFSGIGVSPRFDVAFVAAVGDEPSAWIPFRPLPEALTFWQHFKRFVHNPQWNEHLFLNSCAERLFDGGGDFYQQEIATHLLNAIHAGEVSAAAAGRFMCFRIRAIYSEDAPANCMGRVRDDVVFQSGCYALSMQGSVK